MIDKTEKTSRVLWENHSGTDSFFQNEGIFVQLDELDELDKITHA